MCDYSLHAVATRPAEVAETLFSTNFSTGRGGFASPDDPKVAVCLRPGTEIAFENEVQTGGMMFRKSVGDRLVPRHSDYDWLILSQSRMGKSCGATRIWMLLATPG